MIVTLLHDADSILSWWQRMPSSFKTWLGESRDTQLKVLKTADEVRSVHRAQGQVEVWEQLIGLDKQIGPRKGN